MDYARTACDKFPSQRTNTQATCRHTGAHESYIRQVVVDRMVSKICIIIMDIRSIINHVPHGVLDREQNKLYN